MVVLCEVTYQLKLNDNVLATDYSGSVFPGVIQGYTKDDGQIKIIVAHDPKTPNLPEVLMQLYKDDIWVLAYYPPEQVSPYKK
ncbi:MAG TPA: hypothetical protein VN364_12810 [Bellilinea sp.]|nr:hypothetical protein [Bellilinea sp.]